MLLCLKILIGRTDGVIVIGKRRKVMPVCNNPLLLFYCWYSHAHLQSRIRQVVSALSGAKGNPPRSAPLLPLFVE